MKHYTVIGYYESTGSAYAMPHHAASEFDAMVMASKQCDEPEDLCIIGAIAGMHGLVTPGCDNDRSAWAVDLKEFEVNYAA